MVDSFPTQTPTNEPGTAGDQSEGRNLQSWLHAVALGALWLPVLQMLSPQWSYYEQYSYGWAVPVLCLFLAWRRWRTPSASASDLRPLSSTSHSDVRLSTFQFLSFSAFLLFLLPLRVLQDANPLWRLASYALALDAIAITLLLAHALGGARSVQRFAFPVCFFLIAVPWPTPVETFVVQGLTRFNTMAVTEIMNGLGVAALAHGNVIEVSTGKLGIEEACSGIRSLQAVLMISLFFGELSRLTVLKRIGLVLSAFTAAIAFNVVRTSTLVWLAARYGIDVSNRWHDMTGTVVLVSCFVAVWAISRLFGKDSVPSPDEVPLLRPLTISGIPQRMLWLVVGFSALSVAGSEIWFRWHQREHAWSETLTLSFPRDSARFREVPISPNVRSQLQFDRGDSALWQNADGTFWQFFHFRWEPASRLKDRVRTQLSKSHRPEICLSANGWKLEKESEPTLVKVSGVPIIFRTYDFSSPAGAVFVFFSVREDATEIGVTGNMRETHAARWRAAWEGNRGLGQRVIEIAISGATDLAEAEASLRQELPRIVQLERH